MTTAAQQWGVLCLGAVLVVACAPERSDTIIEGQILLFVSTDAPLPAAPGATVDPEGPAPLFDTLRIETFKPGDTTPCNGCVRDFALNTRLVLDGQVSIGIIPAVNREGYRVRLRLFRSINVSQGEPFATSTIESVVDLPPISSEGVVEAGVFLGVDDVGRRRGSLEEPLPALRGRPDFDSAGTWPGAQRKPCSAQPRPDEVCVPGGAFWMGNPDTPVQGDGTEDPMPRLVVLSPFLMSRNEVSVAAFRAAGLAELAPSGDVSGDPQPAPSESTSSEAAPNELADLFAFCDYVARSDEVQDRLPVNCISWAKARSYCVEQGGDLPSEAQFEYVASGLESRRYVWGDDEPACSDAVWGRGGVGAFANANATCRPSGDAGGPLESGRGERDYLRIDGEEINDLVGNLNEWMLDQWNSVSEPCWYERPLLRDPVCATPSAVDADWRAIHGGAWPNPIRLLGAANRFGRPALEKRPQTGFRCARPAG